MKLMKKKGAANRSREMSLFVCGRGWPPVGFPAEFVRFPPIFFGFLPDFNLICKK